MKKLKMEIWILFFRAAEPISAKRRNKLLQNRSDEKTPKELPQTLAFLPLIPTFFAAGPMTGRRFWFHYDQCSIFFL
ncbi:hypothetical protein [Angelakisella massiliensis]|uniref:hypothetical protein n=1 Tax=Angelakisella massiliensis TaxID=1871018 RepID=UPI001113800F|nr:hypothetical protein [Angelakisella massiliensis]